MTWQEYESTWPCAVCGTWVDRNESHSCEAPGRRPVVDPSPTGGLIVWVLVAVVGAGSFLIGLLIGMNL